MGEGRVSQDQPRLRSQESEVPGGLTENDGHENDGPSKLQYTKLQDILLLLLSCAKSHMLSASRRQPHLLHVSALDRRQTWSMDKI